MSKKETSSINNTSNQLSGPRSILSFISVRIGCGYDIPGSSVGKESSWNVGDLGSIPELGRSPGGGCGNPLQYSCLKNPQGQRSLVGCSPWGHKEDMTEWLSTAQHANPELWVQEEETA